MKYQDGRGGSGGLTPTTAILARCHQHQGLPTTLTGRWWLAPDLPYPQNHPPSPILEERERESEGGGGDSTPATTTQIKVVGC
ncbi:hypothetical protein CRG98_027863 [Punica granatum]|uniref:Uncharacterized protein n=1 Tax=Punica granatum TaxID=22663 RepID=A0A2I0J732_PUNGR|nr:hypothetical protein CRG98_027863 [Punica granatum]